MEAIFLKLLNMGITAGWLALAVMALRPLLKKAPRWSMGVLWAFVGVRLVCPVSVKSGLSLIPSVQTIPQDIMTTNTPAIHTGITAVNQVVNPALAQSFAPSPVNSANPMQILVFLGTIIWLAGMGAIALYTIVSVLRLRRKLREAVPMGDPIWVCDRITTPFLLGLFHPRIYLPSFLEETDRTYVLAHEKAHLQRRDHLWKILGFILLAVYWFHPILWVAYGLFCRDIELACDEKALKALGPAAKKPYSDALINCSVSRHTIAACPLAFGETGVKERVKHVLRYKKPTVWAIGAAAVVCLAAALFLLTNPMGTHIEDKLADFLEEQIRLHNRSAQTGDNFVAVDYRVLDTETDGSETTVYLWVMCLEYRQEEGALVQEAGAHIPTVITVQNQAQTYHLVEYWAPRDGSYYTGDIQQKFPAALWGKALDGQRYAGEQEKACRAKAEEHFSQQSLAGQYAILDWIYDSGVYSSDPSMMAGSQYLITDNLELLDTENENPLLSSWHSVGQLEQFQLDAQNFDALLELSPIWRDGFSAQTLRQDNRSAFRLTVQKEEDTALFYVLQQTDGAVYLAYGYEDGDHTHIRWIFQLNQVTLPGNVQAAPASDASLEKTYSFWDGEDILHTASVSLHDDGTFQFEFSPLSSYIGFGSYRQEGDRLILETQDGKFTYVFTIEQDCLIFDGERSSDMVWFSGLTDGARFV